MREKLNENPLAQVVLIGVLLIAAGVFAMSSMGGGGGGSEETESSSTATSTAAVSTTAGATPASISSVPPVPAQRLPHRVTAAFDANRTVVLLIVKKGGIDDAMTVIGSLPLAFTRGVSLFVVPAKQISRYAAITQGVGVERVPALVVVRPKDLDHGSVTASLSYGFQTPQSIEQAVIDARYKGRTLSYHP